MKHGDPFLLREWLPDLHIRRGRFGGVLLVQGRRGGRVCRCGVQVTSIRSVLRSSNVTSKYLRRLLDMARRFGGRDTRGWRHSPMVLIHEQHEEQGACKHDDERENRPVRHR